MAQMQKQGRPTDAKADEWQQDLNPQLEAGQNPHLQGLHPEKSDQG
ncbi:hypothetical protein [Anabaena sp. PCC 7108]|nr:hypothetical protein [Anabaena sp. PCC 7108]